ncbi:hypothetical protein AVEN_131932-1 [Araneus ventricosus]|uniref:Uncharacterized protein n=1 Tax=Araneus ventricosus TaxID=182803 RepID=A0A4Y2B4E6_ARAVE|nr:hypothetical protein AVEN_131932-1 [Araneus ventricosus]
MTHSYLSAYCQHGMLGPLWPSCKISGPGTERSLFETQFHLRSVVYGGLVNAKSYVEGQMFYCVISSESEMVAQVSSSPSDDDLKLQGPSQNDPLVTPKRGANIKEHELSLNTDMFLMLL